MTEDQTRFLKLVAGPALEAEALHSIPAPITMAQAILESNWGKSKLAVECRNLFGVKAGHRAGTEVYGEHDYPTWEKTAGGRAVLVEAGFIDYPSVAECFADHSRLFHQLARYSMFVECGANYVEDLDLWRLNPAEYTLSQVRHDLDRAAIELGPAVKKAGGREMRGYSTEPNYAHRLMKLIDELHLDERAVLKAFALAPAPPVGAAPEAA